MPHVAHQNGRLARHVARVNEPVVVDVGDQLGVRTELRFGRHTARPAVGVNRRHSYLLALAGKENAVGRLDGDGCQRRQAARVSRSLGHPAQQTLIRQAADFDLFSPAMRNARSRLLQDQALRGAGEKIRRRRPSRVSAS